MSLHLADAEILRTHADEIDRWETWDLIHLDPALPTALRRMADAVQRLPGLLAGTFIFGFAVGGVVLNLFIGACR